MAGGQDVIELGNYSDRVARQRLFSDLDLTFEANPVTGDVPILLDAAAVKRAVRNLVLTEFFERPFQPNIGSGVRRLLFENATPLTAISLRETIVNVIERYEPRVTLLDVTVVDLSDYNTYEVTITFAVTGIQEEQSYTIYLRRTR